MILPKKGAENDMPKKGAENDMPKKEAVNVNAQERGRV